MKQGIVLIMLLISLSCSKTHLDNKWIEYHVKPNKHDAGISTSTTTSESLAFEIMFPKKQSSQYKFSDSLYQDSWNKASGFWSSVKTHECFTWRFFQDSIQLGVHTHTRDTSIYKLFTSINYATPYLCVINRVGDSCWFRLFNGTVLMKEQKLPFQKPTINPITGQLQRVGIQEIWFGGKYRNPADHDIIIRIRFLF